MAIQFVKVKKNIVFGPNPGEKFIARIVREQSVNLDYIAEQIAGASTMSKADVMGVLQQLQVEMSYHLLRGASVRLGLLGTFTPNLRAKSQESADLVKADTIKGLHIAFRPSPWLTYQIKNAKFNYVDTSIKNIIREAAADSTEIAQMNALLEERQKKEEKSKGEK
jgi:predicted histone-like DNA-binding protein